MKKVLFTIISVLLLVFTFSMFNAKGIDAKSTKVSERPINDLFTEYYNGGIYRKDTKIYVDSDKVSADFFHDGQISLVRRTYYNGNKLWMTDVNNEMKINSGYGTSENGHLTHFKKDSNGNEIDVVEIDYLPAMEEYYLTLHDFVQGVHNSNHSENQDLNLADGWTYSNGVYTNSNVDLIEAFRLFTAPLFLQITEEYKFYFSFSHVTVEVDSNNNLVMSLWVNADNKGVMTSEEVNGHYLFSQAVIRSEKKDTFTYSINEDASNPQEVAYDPVSGTYSFEVSFKIWGRMILTYNGTQLNPENVTIAGMFYPTAANWDERLYYELGKETGNHQFLCPVSGGKTVNYLVTYNPNTNVLTINSQIPVAYVNQVSYENNISYWSAGTVVRNSSNTWCANPWKLYLVVDSEGRICYMTAQPGNGYGGINSTNYYMDPYYQQDNVSNPALKVNGENWEVVAPEGGFAIACHGTLGNSLIGILTEGRITTYSSNLVTLNSRTSISAGYRLSYDSTNKVINVTYVGK